MAKIKNSQIKSSLLLLLASLVWGLAFVAQSVAGGNVGTFTFNGIRFIIGGFCLSSPLSWVSILYTGIFSCAVGYTLQAVGQRDLNPALASLIMSLESVFSSVFGWLILHQTMSGREALGCVLIFTAVILAQIPQKNRGCRFR